MFQKPPPDVSPIGDGGGPEVNKFEQVSSDGHQMSPVWRRSEVPRKEGGRGKEALDSAMQCIVGNVYLKLSPEPCGQTDTTENITFPKTYLRAIIISN